jgi:phosphate transport system permease protein
MIFRGFGLGGIILALGFVAILFTTILSKGIPAFTAGLCASGRLFRSGDHRCRTRPGPQRAGFSLGSRVPRRQPRLAAPGGDAQLEQVVERAVRNAAPAGYEIDTRQVQSIVENRAPRHPRPHVRRRSGPARADRAVEVLASANVDNWLKGTINRSLGDAQQQLSAPARALPTSCSKKAPSASASPGRSSPMSIAAPPRPRPVSPAPSWARST